MNETMQISLENQRAAAELEKMSSKLDSAAHELSAELRQFKID